MRFLNRNVGTNLRNNAICRQETVWEILAVKYIFAGILFYHTTTSSLQIEFELKFKYHILLFTHIRMALQLDALMYSRSF